MLKLIYLLLILTLNFSCTEKKSTEKETSNPELAAASKTDTLKFSSGISAIFQDSKGNYWFGSLQEGAAVYNGKSFLYFNSDDGLPDNQIHNIHEDKKGIIWFGDRDAGIWKYDGARMTNYTKKYGLTNDNALSISEDNKGELWFGMADGKVYKVNGKTFEKQF